MFCGMDLGSRNVKLAIRAGDGPWDFRRFDTVQFYRQYGSKVGEELKIDFAGLGLGHIDKLVTTGYGRNTIKLVGAEVIAEIKAHVIGAIYQTGLQDFTLLDLGGQDSKIVKIKKGKMVDFQTNDKCAASTGRYLENMAAVLGVELSELSQHYSDPVELNSTCAIFGESELIGKIVDGHSISSLCAGVNYTIFKRIQPLLKKLASPTVVFTGGVAHSLALQKIISAELGCEVVVPEHPQYNGAIGCWVHAGGK